MGSFVGHIYHHLIKHKSQTVLIIIFRHRHYLDINANGVHLVPRLSFSISKLVEKLKYNTLHTLKYNTNIVLPVFYFQ